MTELPAWASRALNGTSTRGARRWEPQPGDLLAGEVVDLRESSRGAHGAHVVLVVRVETGSSGGEPVPPGEWMAVECVPAVLRAWIARDKPVVGDRIAVQLRGRNRSRLDYVAGAHREPVPADWS